jgi:hypothetical protein
MAAAAEEQQQQPLQRWTVLHSPRVAIRSGPSTAAAIIGVVKTGTEVQSRGPPRDNWIELAASSAPTGPTGSKAGWMMVDGAEVSLGMLLQRQVQLPLPRVLFAGARALIVSWDAGSDNDDMPVVLEVHHGEGGNGLALRQPDKAVRGSVATRRVGGLQPDTLLSLRLAATPDGPGGGNSAHTAATAICASEWATVRTRPAASTHDRPLRRSVTRGDGTSCSGSPDVFGRLRGQPLASTGARVDCPGGLWMPSELLHGGLNAAVANFRCGDCCLPPAEHEDLGPAQQPAAQQQQQQQRRLAKPEPEPEPEPVALSRDQYLAEFRRWDSMQPSWRRLYRDEGASEGDHSAGGSSSSQQLAALSVSAVLATSDIHIDFPDNQRWLDSLRAPDGGRRRCALIVAGDVCTSLPKMRAAFEKLTSIYTHVFFVPVRQTSSRLFGEPFLYQNDRFFAKTGSGQTWGKLRKSGWRLQGNHELWTAKREANSVQKFLDIMRLCDECGVQTRPAWVAPGVAIIPLFSWYKTGALRVLAIGSAYI